MLNKLESNSIQSFYNFQKIVFIFTQTIADNCFENTEGGGVS